MYYNEVGPNNPKDAIVRRQIDAVEFGFYSDDEIRARSIVEVTTSQSYDPLKHALLNGLYDPRLGPHKQGDTPCPTCALQFRNCPGHFGHIELVVPVYHPLLFSEVLSFLRCKCLACHKFKLSQNVLNAYRVKFYLLGQGQVVEYMDVDRQIMVARRQAREHEAYNKNNSSDSNKSTTALVVASAKRECTTTELDAIGKLLQKMTTATSTDNDNNTTATNKRTQETAFVKNLRRDLIKDFLATCKAVKKCAHCNGQSPRIRHDNSNKIFQTAMSRKMQRENEHARVVIESAVLLDNNNNNETGSNANKYESDDSDESVNSDAMQVDSETENADKKTFTEIDTDNHTSPDKFMHAGEVQAQLRRTWASEPYLCNALFFNGTTADTNGFLQFFMQVVAVPPSRFRPPLMMGGSAIEHSQTAYLSSIISSNERVRNNFATGDEPRAYTAWIDLQTAVNCLMDSSKDPDAYGQVAPGVKQMLERKEGLFRKNIMGKRVDYACRSVISPDPYIGTNEIGIPRYFANILTYPVPVTDLNSREMRQLVERGANQYPGARWVEMDGVRVDLTKMKSTSREAIGAQLLTHVKRGGLPAMVGRQLRDGDYVLMNRQPTLHKPGIMAHRVRVLHSQTQKTIRMHYANCLAGDSKVLMADGTTMRIDEVPTGAQVSAWTACKDPTTVTNTKFTHDIGGSHTVIKGKWLRGVQECVTLMLEDGRKLVGTPDHRVLACQLSTNNPVSDFGNAVWVPISKLSVDNSDSSWRVVCSATNETSRHNSNLCTLAVTEISSAGTLPVYDLEVEDVHNFVANGIVVHNCNTYNADFDGDEMNCHYPQNDLGQAEAQFIARTDLQYIAPTDGSPLRGLIQDHVVGGVKMTKKDTFFERWEYQQLLFSALASLPGLEVIRLDADIEMLPPTIVKPRELWTGKQVVSTLLLHLRKGNDRDAVNYCNFPGISAERKAKTPESAFGAGQDEHLVLIRDGELLRGVLDKSAYGATEFSLIHAVHEAYGPEKAGLLLNVFGRLFTAYIQFYSGHSCRMEDLVLTAESDETRRSLVKRAYTLGTRAAKAWADSEGGKVTIQPLSEDVADKPLKPVEIASAASKIGQLLSGSEGAANFAQFDAFMQSQLNPLSSKIVKECLPHGLAVPFPYNTFSVMTTTGAKGSIVNQSQVTCALGQQALEGRRVPRMSSGKTLPSFSPYDPNPRADGFVLDRFLTGIRPQEYYFHCMAGREGLVDTAVKTSRSGYLQRCLMKHLEELKIGYDFTVRNAENDVIQFLYGEDALDPTKAAYLDCTDKSFSFMMRNMESLKRHNTALPSSTVMLAAEDAENAEGFVHNQDDDITFSKGQYVMARKLRDGDTWTRGSLCKGWYPATVTKVHKGKDTVDLRYHDGLKVKDVPIEAKLLDKAQSKKIPLSYIAQIVKPAVRDPITCDINRKHRLGQSGACVSERVALSTKQALEKRNLSSILDQLNLPRKDVDSIIGAKYSSSLCAPGEAVGSIAAQSIGEPSTQMTLNTFHLAGSGANVTLGIPRLREIIMTASRAPKTPTMSIPIQDSVSDKAATKLMRQFSKLTLMELIAGKRGLIVTERLEKSEGGDWSRTYYVTLKLHPAERIKEAFGLSIQQIAAVVANKCVSALTKLVKKELKRSAAEGNFKVASLQFGDAAHQAKGNRSADAEDEEAPKSNAKDDIDELDEGDDDDDDDDVAGEEDGADVAKERSQRKNSISYDDEGDADSVRQAKDDDDDDDSSLDEPGQKSTTMNKDDDDDNSVTNMDDTDNGDLGHDLSAFKDFELTVNAKKNTISLQPIRVDPAARPLLMVGLVEKAAESTIVRQKKNISESFVNEEDDRGRCLQLAGVNFIELWMLSESMVQHDALLSNDIWAIRCAYGVEAARNNIMTQIRNVFAAYGIQVDPRHLSLIADYMTFEGEYKPMNRNGMQHSSSAMLQMSFETTIGFLRQAAMYQTREVISSPSANITIGRPVQHGTGAFTLLAKQQ